MSLLKIKDLNKTYENINALSDVNITIEGGKIVGLLGKNGAGKSTLIKIINGLLQKDSGEILLNGKKITFKEKDAIAYLPERSYLNKNMRVIDYFNYMSDFYESFNVDKAFKLLENLKLNPNMKISKMSKGMQEKLQLILVMARDAELYILDEPLGGVDPATRDYILDTILTNFKEGASVIISTHLINDIEKILDEVIFIDDGKVILSKNGDSLREESNSSIDEVFRRMFKC